MADILIVDDDQQVRETMESLITRRGHTAVSAASITEAREMTDSSDFDVIFLDIRLPDGNGLDLLPHLSELPDVPEVIILTGRGDPDGAELAIQGGVWDYLVKPSSVKELTLSLERALKYREEKHGRSEAVALNLENVVGVSPLIRQLFNKVALAAISDANVLLTGETGTGKELFARTIHANSPRAAHEFVVVDCASLTETLVESTLFGHRKGAFTGAQANHAGLVKLADKGTLFLDEVGEMPLSVQKSFLRVLQERAFRPVGETREVKSDFRLISATNKNLDHMVKAGSFREDLLFRLKTMQLHLPPLRQRPEDLKPLTLHHIGRLCERYGLPIKGFDADFFDVLGDYAWPGNVRELFNVLERAFVAAGREPTLYAKHLPQEVRIHVTRAQLEKTRRQSEDAPKDAAGEAAGCSGSGCEPCVVAGMDAAGLTLKEAKLQAEKCYLEGLINEIGADVPQLMEVSGLSRSHLYALLKKYNLNLP